MGKRAKQYKKLMQQYGLAFGFREPYQILLDAEMLKDADRFKIDLIGSLEKTLHGKVKPMITQCSMRHLYASAKDPGMSLIIDKAKVLERRRCDHRPEEYPEPLSALECISSVVDPKGTKHNKHRYVIASQELDVRKAMRAINGVPLIYINRSVMIMEPMAGLSSETRDREERTKFRDGLKTRANQGVKRKRGDDEGELEHEKRAPTSKDRGSGAKGPNPLSVRKAKKMPVATPAIKPPTGNLATDRAREEDSTETGTTIEVKRKRRRKHKSSQGDVL